MRGRRALKRSHKNIKQTLKTQFSFICSKNKCDEEDGQKEPNLNLLVDAVERVVC